MVGFHHDHIRLLFPVPSSVIDVEELLNKCSPNVQRCWTVPKTSTCLRYSPKSCTALAVTLDQCDLFWVNFLYVVQEILEQLWERNNGLASWADISLLGHAAYGSPLNTRSPKCTYILRLAFQGAAGNLPCPLNLGDFQNEVSGWSHVFNFKLPPL